MSKTQSAKLQIDTSDALKQIEALSEKLTTLKQEFGGDSKAFAIKLSVDQQSVNQVQRTLNSLMTRAQQQTASTNSRQSQLQTQALKNQQNAYEAFWDSQMTNAERYARKLNEIKLANQQQAGIAGYNVMSSQQRQAKLGAATPSGTLSTSSNAPLGQNPLSLGMTQADNYLKQLTTKAFADFNAKMDAQAQARIDAAKIQAAEEKQRAAQEAANAKAEAARQAKLDKAIDAEIKEREARQRKFDKMDADDEKLMEKVRQLRSRSEQMGEARREKHAEQYDKNLDKDTKQLQRNLTSAVKEFDREAQTAERDRAKAIRQTQREEAQARQEQMNALKVQIGQVAVWKQGLQNVNQAFQQAIQLYDKFRQTGVSVLSTIQGTSQQLFNILGLNVDSILSDAVAQEEKLQMARIGFKNMFGEDSVAALEQRVRETAAKSPGLNSGDLADYIAQLGAVATDSDQAFNATMGVLKTVQYGGGDASSQMNYIIKNIRDVMAKGKATQVDVQQFNRAMPLLSKALESIGASDFLKDGQLTITKENAKNLMDAFASLNSPNNPAYGVFEDTAKTWSGIKEEFYETTQNLVNDALREVGFYDALQDIMRNGVFPIVEDAAKYFKDLLSRINAGTDWKAIQVQLRNTWEDVKGAAKEFIDGLIEAFGVVDANGNIDVTETIKMLIKMVGSFFEGLLDGAKMIVSFAGKIKDTMGEEGFSNLMGGLGWAVTGGSVISPLLSGAGNAISTVGSLGLDLYQNSLLKQLTTLQAGGAATKSVGIVGKGLNGLSSLMGGSGFSAGKLMGGLGLYGLSTTIGTLITDLNLLGDASKAVGSTVTVAGGTLGGALTGLAFGPLGAVAGGMLGLAASAAQAQDELRKLEVKDTDEKISAERLAELTDIADQAAALLTEQGSKMDWASDEGKWVKQALINEMAGMTQAELNEFVTSGKAYDRFAELSNMKQRQVAMSLVDNDEGFWDIQGAKAQLIIDNRDGTFSATARGEQFADIIRANNMVGWDNAKDLEEASAATLIQAYTQKQGLAANDVLNDSQIQYLIDQSGIIAQNVAETTTNFADQINKAVEEAGGNVASAVRDAEAKGDEAFAAVLEMYRVMKERANSASQYMLGELEGDQIVNPETIRSLYGDQAADAAERWGAHTKGLNGLWDMGNWDRLALGSAFGMGNAFAGEATFSNLTTRVYKADQVLNEMIQEATGERKETLQAVREALQGNINEMNSLKEGDWGGLLDVLSRIAKMLSYYGIDITKEDVAVPVTGRKGGGGWATGGFVGRKGHIVPVYRASGGDARGVDTISAMLSPGEFVQRASAVSKAGFGVMNALNQGDLATAYRLLGAKVDNNYGRSWSSSDSHDTRQAQTIINNNYGRSARANAYYGGRNFMALS